MNVLIIILEMRELYEVEKWNQRLNTYTYQLHVIRFFDNVNIEQLSKHFCCLNLLTALDYFTNYLKTIA